MEANKWKVKISIVNKQEGRKKSEICYILGRGKTKVFIRTLLLQSFSTNMFQAGLEPATFRV